MYRYADTSRSPADIAHSTRVALSSAVATNDTVTLSPFGVFTALRMLYLALTLDIIVGTVEPSSHMSVNSLPAHEKTTVVLGATVAVSGSS